MPKKKSHPVTDQFSDEDMEQIKRYGQALGDGVTPFDEEVERYLARYEANRKNIEAAKVRRIKCTKAGPGCKKSHW